MWVSKAWWEVTVQSIPVSDAEVENTLGTCGVLAGRATSFKRMGRPSWILGVCPVPVRELAAIDPVPEELWSRWAGRVPLTAHGCGSTHTCSWDCRLLFIESSPLEAPLISFLLTRHLYPDIWHSVVLPSLFCAGLFCSFFSKVSNLHSGLLLSLRRNVRQGHQLLYSHFMSLISVLWKTNNWLWLTQRKVLTASATEEFGFWIKYSYHFCNSMFVSVCLSLFVLFNSKNKR